LDKTAQEIKKKIEECTATIKTIDAYNIKEDDKNKTDKVVVDLQNVFKNIAEDPTLLDDLRNDAG
jgi:hypothetical protein